MKSQKLQKVLEIFYEIASIPHGSGDTLAMREFIESFCIDCGYSAKTDNAGNILAFLDSIKSLESSPISNAVCVSIMPSL